MYVTWLVADTYAFDLDPGPTSNLDRRVPGLTYREWFEVFFVVLRVAPEKTAGLENCGRDAHISGFKEEIADYPMLSRICGITWDAVFESDEIQELEDECKRVLENNSNLLASQGLKKILFGCQEAKRLNLSLFMMGK
jgi:hypothetical protein